MCLYCIPTTDRFVFIRNFSLTPGVSLLLSIEALGDFTSAQHFGDMMQRDNRSQTVADGTVEGDEGATRF